jgi:hypothetical protein
VKRLLCHELPVVVSGLDLLFVVVVVVVSFDRVVVVLLVLALVTSALAIRLFPHVERHLESFVETPK